MAEPIRVTLALPLSAEMVKAISSVSPLFEVAQLSRGERFVYRDVTETALGTLLPGRMVIG